MNRSSGTLLHISSLPGEYGIGDFGEGAYAFLEFLKASGQSFWQILPFGLTGAGDSPYQSFSAFAGNPYFIDLSAFIKMGLLNKKEIRSAHFKKDEKAVDYHKLYHVKMKLLRLAYYRALPEIKKTLEGYFDKERDWLEDFSTFMALKTYHNGEMWRHWDVPYRLREPDALAHFKNKFEDEIYFWIFTQYYFFEQWHQLKATANEAGIKIIGDLPIYVAEDSADVWAAPDNYMLTELSTPVCVSGCPPDAFSETGQLWGNPIYDWEQMSMDGYSWWIKRFRASFENFDFIRVDHFRGFESYWQIPYGEPTAEFGQWLKGPGVALFKAVEEALSLTGEGLPIIAEDLGILTDEVHEMRKALGYPGMRILQFAFDTLSESTYLPHHYSLNDVVYTGTHDNQTIMGWIDSAPDDQVAYAKEYLLLDKKEGYHMGMIRALYQSSAGLVIIPMQDFLGQDDSARMNLPGTVGGNWIYRITLSDLSKNLTKQIDHLNKLYSRNK